MYRDTRTDWRSRVINALMWWPTKRLILDAVTLTPGEMERFIRDFNTVKPALLHGYVGSVDHLASFIEERGLRVAPPKAIWVTSAPLTSVQEKRIEKAFGGPVYDQYGSCEVYWLAAQYPVKGPLHTFGDIRRIEFLNEENQPCPPGDLGKIAVTDFENRLFPIIRYLNGDMGRAMPGVCSCGVTLPLMDKVAGRVTDMVRMPNGTCISGDYLTTIFDDTPDAVKQFRVNQRADYSLEVLVVPNPQFPNLDTLLARVREGLLTRAEGQVPVEIHKVEHIQQKGGKLRFVSSDVK